MLTLSPEILLISLNIKNRFLSILPRIFCVHTYLSANKHYFISSLPICQSLCFLFVCFNIIALIITSSTKQIGNGHSLLLILRETINSFMKIDVRCRVFIDGLEIVL